MFNLITYLLFEGRRAFVSILQCQAQSLGYIVDATYLLDEFEFSFKVEITGHKSTQWIPNNSGHQDFQKVSIEVYLKFKETW